MTIELDSMDTRKSISIPSTEIEITLGNLVQISVRKSFHPLTFNKLFKEFKHRVLSNNPTLDEIDLFELFDGCSTSPLQLKYIYEVLIHSDLNNDFDDFSKLFSKYMFKLNKNDQVVIMLYLNQINQDEFPWSKLIDNEQFPNSFSSYLKAVCSSGNVNYEDDSRLILMISKFIINLLKFSTKPNTHFNEAAKEFIEFQSNNGFKSSYKYISDFYSSYNYSTSKTAYQSSIVSHNSQSHSRNNFKVLKLKKIIWLSQQATIDFTPITDVFIKSFKSILNLSSVATSATNTSIVYELVTSLFECLELSTQKTKHIWCHFIEVKLPLLLKLLKINQLKLGNTLMNVFESSGVVKYKELMISLLKNLVGSELIKASDFIKLFPELSLASPLASDLEYNELSTIYNSKFHEINPEFISIEESGVSQFINQLSTSTSMKDTFTELITKSIQIFIKENDSLRLRRLLISLALNKSMFEYVILKNTPYEFIKPLTEYLDKNIDKSHESLSSSGNKNELSHDDMMDLDMGGADSANAQNFYTDFGAMLVFLKTVSHKFNLNLLSITSSTLTNSSSLQIINNWDSIKNSAYFEQIQNSNSRLNNIINDWVVSLFDSSNTDGLSDELIKTCSIKEYYYIIPDILKEAIMALKLGYIDHDSLINGLEYFHQPFLISNLLNLFEFIIDFIWSSDDANPNDKDYLKVVCKILEKLCFVELEDGEVKVLHKLIMDVMHDQLHSALIPYKESVVEVEEFLDKLGSSQTDVLNETVTTSNLKELVEYMIDPQVVAKFELTDIYRLADSYSSEVDWFFDKLITLLQPPTSSKSNNIQSSDLVEMLNYEMISLLIINYASWKTSSNLKYWISILSSFNISNISDSENNKVELIYNRKGSDTIKIENSLDSEEQNLNDDENNEVKEETAMAFDSNFFGFIEEPQEFKERDNMNGNAKTDDGMDIDEIKVEEDGEEVINSDGFISNILVLIKLMDDSNSDVVRNLVSKIESNLSSF